jgi:hypothetical protein
MAKKGGDPKTKAAVRARKELTTAQHKERRQLRHQKALDKKRRKLANRAREAVPALLP